MFSASSLAAAPVGSVLSSERGKSAGIKFPPTASLSCFHADCDGHVASEGRRRRKVVLADGPRGKIGRRAADPIAFKNALLFISPFLVPSRSFLPTRPARGGNQVRHFLVEDLEGTALVLGTGGAGGHGRHWTREARSRLRPGTRAT